MGQVGKWALNQDHICCSVTFITIQEDLMSANAFVPFGEVIADERARISFGKAGVRRDDKYAVAPKIRFSEEQVFVEL